MRSSVRRLAAVLVVAASSPLIAQSIEVGTGPTVSEAIPDGYVASGPLHRLLVPSGSNVLNTVTALDAALAVEDYGSFQIVLVDEVALGGREALLALGREYLRDDLTLVNVNGIQLDGADLGASARALGRLPFDLLAPAAPPADGDSRLKLVQFAGPVKDAWLAALAATGAFVVTYVPNNAYVVRANPVANAAIEGLKAAPFVLAVHDYHPGLKLRAELRPPVLDPGQVYPVTLQIIGDAEGASFAAALASKVLSILHQPNPVLTYVNVDVSATGAQVLALAEDPHVFAIEPLLEARLLDERQGQIMANNLNAAGTQPSAPGYFAWLQSQGFPGAGNNPFSFAVDVTDDGIDQGNTTSVNSEFKVDGLAGGASRVAYAFDYTSDPTADGRAGHGNINASIIGGYNTQTGTAFEDSLGYQYGLGIAPWVKVGNTKVFDNAGGGDFASPANTRLQNAYNASARISNNSWGFTSGTTYNADSQLHDSLVRDAASGTTGNQELTILFAAGNSGPGASTVHPPGTAKNIITVGASENYRPTGSDGCGIGNTGADNVKDIISFSSRGPTSDSRKKPELVAPGTHIQGAASLAVGYDGTGVCNQYFPAGQTLYAWSSGTSHSTPAAAGAAALLRQWSVNNGLGTPSPAMIKACLMNGTTYLTGVSANDTLWSNVQGMGNINMARAFDSTAKIRVDQTQVLGATGATYTVAGNVATSAQPFRVTLTWTDAPGPTTGNAFVNNLDLEVTLNGTLYRGNVFSGANSIAGGAADIRNNAESVFFPAGTTGSFSITVRATNVAGDGVPGNGDTTDQDFALLVYNGSAGVPTPDFSLSATPGSQTITAGGSVNYTVSNSALNGFAGSVTLSASPAISGVSYAFAPNPQAANGSSTLAVTSTTGATTGTHNITITGTSGALVRTTNVSLTINPIGGGGNPVKTFSAAPNAAIPDNNATGTTSTINVADSLTVSSIAVSTVITHPFKGDLVATLIGPDGTSAILHNRTGGSADNVTTTFAIVTAPAAALTVFNGKNTAGNWQLRVQDLAGSDVGTLNSWTITFNGEKAVTANLAIPDNNATGVTSTQNYTQTGTVASVKVRTNITHTYKGDLVVTLIAPDGTSAILHNLTGGATDNVNTEFPDLTASAQSLAVFTGKTITGNWQLRVQDLGAADLGTLVNWTLSLTAQ